MAASVGAMAAGVRIGMPLAEALALQTPTAGTRAAVRRGTFPQAGWCCEPHDPAADRAALEDLAQWCEQFSPIVGLEDAAAPECLLLDVTGCARVFHGERKMLERVVEQFARRGYVVYAALADTIGAAWALAHHCDSATLIPGLRIDCRHAEQPSATAASRWVIVPAGRSVDALRPLPLEALRLPADAVRLLAELGIRHIGQLLLLERSSLAGRFGPELLERLEQTTGELHEVIVPYRQGPPVEAQQSFEAPIAQHDLLQTALRRLLEQLIRQLEPEQGVLRLDCRLDLSESRTEGQTIAFSVDLFQPTGSVEHLLELLNLRLDRLRTDARVVGHASSLAHAHRFYGGTISQLACAPLAVRVRARRAEGGQDRSSDDPHADAPAPAVRGPIAAISLRMSLAGRRTSRQQELFVDESTAGFPFELAALWDRLRSRLGRRAVVRAVLVADAQPEYACQYEEIVRPAKRARQGSPRRRSTPIADACDSVAKRDGGAAGSQRCGLLRRPLRLARTPQPIAVVAVVPEGPPIRFRWAGREYAVARAHGPERIATGWWRQVSSPSPVVAPSPDRAPAELPGRGGEESPIGPSHRAEAVCRDYYRVETTAGERYWLFRRCRDGRWFLHGWFE